VTDKTTIYVETPGALIGMPVDRNAGTDTVYATTSSYTLSAFIENLQASRAVAFTGIGNTLNNTIEGHSGADTLKGLVGNDVLIGHGGRDVLYGGKAPADTGPTLTQGPAPGLVPGSGVQVDASRDVFRYTSTSDSGTTASTRDLIADFEQGRDLIDLAAIDARAGNKSSVLLNEAFNFIGTETFDDVAGQLRYSHVSSFGRVVSTIVEGDTNGDGIANFQIELSGRHSLAANDFML